MLDGKLRVSFDIGGVLSKYPDVFRSIVAALAESHRTEVFVITDMPDHAQAVQFVQGNGYAVAAENILCADYAHYGESCKERVIAKYAIDLHIDDFPGYCAHSRCVSLFVWPNPAEPYYADSFVTDGSEGGFGRSVKSAADSEDAITANNSTPETDKAPE